MAHMYDFMRKALQGLRDEYEDHMQGKARAAREGLAFPGEAERALDQLDDYVRKLAPENRDAMKVAIEAAFRTLDVCKYLEQAKPRDGVEQWQDFVGLLRFFLRSLVNEVNLYVEPGTRHFVKSVRFENDEERAEHAIEKLSDLRRDLNSCGTLNMALSMGALKMCAFYVAARGLGAMDIASVFSHELFPEPLPPCGNFEIVRCQEDREKDANLRKKIVVFGIEILADEGTEDRDLILCANVLAQWLDNDQDGSVDDPAVLRAMLARGAVLILHLGHWWNEYHKFWGDGPLQTLDVSTINHYWYGLEPSGYCKDKQSPSGCDAATEESFHLVHNHGYEIVYPDAFSTEDKRSRLAQALDRARGGRFEKVPDKYPEHAWFTYYDKTCGYGCQASEYFHFAMLAFLGFNEPEERIDGIKDEFFVRNAEELKERDPAVYSLLTDATYNLPKQKPTDKYQIR